MGIGVSIVLFAAGAIMAFALEVDSSNGVNLNNAGLILMVVGAIGLIWAAFIYGPRTRRTTVEDDAGRRVVTTTRDGL